MLLQLSVYGDMLYIRINILLTNSDRKLTGLTSGTDCWNRWWSTPNVVHCNHIKLILGVRTQSSYNIKHCNDAANFTESLYIIM